MFVLQLASRIRQHVCTSEQTKMETELQGSFRAILAICSLVVQFLNHFCQRSSENYFCVLPKDRWKATNILSCFFQNEFMLCHIKLNIYTQKTKFTSHKQYLLRLLFSRNAKKKTSSRLEYQTYKLSNVTAIKVFSPVCMFLMQLASMNVFQFM